jgi:hypothetical protein
MRRTRTLAPNALPLLLKCYLSAVQALFNRYSTAILNAPWQQLACLVVLLCLRKSLRRAMQHVQHLQQFQAQLQLVKSSMVQVCLGYA